MLEYWLQSPIDVTLRAVGPRWYELWPSWQSLVSVAQRAGVDFFGLMYGAGADVRAMRYVRGSFLLDWNGRGGAVIFATTDRPDPYHAAWVKQLGTAMKPKRPLASGVWQRQSARSRGREHHERHGHSHRAGKSVDDRPDGRPLREVRLLSDGVIAETARARTTLRSVSGTRRVSGVHPA